MRNSYPVTEVGADEARLDSALDLHDLAVKHANELHALRIRHLEAEHAARMDTIRDAAPTKPCT